MTKRKALGYGVLSLPFIGLYIGMAWGIGLQAATLIAVATGLIFLCISVGINLLADPTSG